MARIIIIGSVGRSLINFRGDLLRAFVENGHNVYGLAGPTDEAIIREIEQLGVKFISIPIQRNRINPFGDIQTYRALRKIFANLKPDVVLAYTIKPVIWSGFALKKKSPARFYALITGLGFAFQGGGRGRGLLEQLVVTLYRRALKHAARVIFQNHDDKNEMIRRGIVPAAKCCVVNGSGVNLERFREIPLPVGEVVFLSIARFLKEKGLREYAQAAQIVKKKYPEAKFRLVGREDPSLDQVPIEEVREWTKNNWVEYLGYLEDVRPALWDCHIFVLVSYHEGMPRTILEAMAIGRPIITTDVSGCRETVIQGENGFLVLKKNASALAARMIWFIENRKQWSCMGRRSREIAEERFDVHEVNSILLKIIFGEAKSGRSV